VNAAHASGWTTTKESNDSSLARSRVGCITTYAGCPMHWTSKMQCEIVLSTAEAEYKALSYVTILDPKVVTLYGRIESKKLEFSYFWWKDKISFCDTLECCLK
jgi:hypothetical protein